MWAPGSSRRRAPYRRVAARDGFTLLELLLVLALLALASSGVMFALRASEHSLLARDADRLVALLEAARASARGSGLAVRWQPEPGGFRFMGLPAGAAAQESVAGDGSTAWLNPGVVVREGAELLLGPEPIIEAQALVLALGEHQMRISTDGLHPFVATPGDAVPGAGSP